MGSFENKYVCDKCGLIFNNLKIKANHIRWKHKEIGYTNEGLVNLKLKTKLNNDKKYGENIQEETNCSVCNTKILIKYRVGRKKEKYFCNKSCANKRQVNHSEETKNKISNTLKENFKNSDTPLINKGKRIFTSKGEMEVRKFFIENFPDDNWTFGGKINFKDESIVRDLYSDKLKVMVEYDGIWHFKNINNQLEKKQKKDYVMEEWVILNGWRLLRVKEEVYKINKEKTIDMIKNFIYNSDEKIIKLY
jgi:hypothetical protein